MKPKEYIRKYKLDSDIKFDHNLFTVDLAQDFINTIEYLQEVKQLNYNRFQTCVKEIKTKFDGIVNKAKAHTDWEKLWKYFYATTIVKIRDKLFSEYLEKQKRQRERKSTGNIFGGLFSEDFFEGLSSGTFYASWSDTIWTERLKGLLSVPQPISAFTTLGLESNCTEKDVQTKYRELALQHHPDKGGNKEKFIELIEAKNKCLVYLGGNIIP